MRVTLNVMKLPERVKEEVEVGIRVDMRAECTAAGEMAPFSDVCLVELSSIQKNSKV